MNAWVARPRLVTAGTTLLFVASLAAPVRPTLAKSTHQVAPSPASRGAAGYAARITSRGVINARTVAAFGRATRHPGRMLPYLSGPGSRSAAPSSPLVVTPPAPVQATITSNPPAAKPGIGGLSKASAPSAPGDPPDPWVGVGPDHVVQVVNTTMRITDRSGSHRIDVGLPQFWGLDQSPFPVYDSDPRVIYDSLHGRWILSEVAWDCNTSDVTAGHGHVLLAISKTSNPTGDWTTLDVTYPDALPDYPAVGTSSDKIGIASNVFGLTPHADCTSQAAYLGSDTLVMDWAEVLNPVQFYFNEYVSDTTYYTPRVALQTPATDGKLRIVVQKLVGGIAHVDYVTISGLVGSATGTPCRFNGSDSCATTSSENDLTAAGVIGAFQDPQPPQQPSGNVTTAIDSRPTDAIWKNNRLSFVSTQACTPTGDTVTRDCMRVSQLNTSTTTPTLAQDFLIASAGEDSYLGGIGMSGNGGLFVAWTQSSATSGDYPSAYAAYQLAKDAANSISPKELLAAGQTNHTGGRWGDYLGVAQDPQDPNAVWQGNEYVPLDGTWATSVNQLKTGAGSTYQPIAPVRLLDTRTGNGLSGAFSANTPRTFTVAGRGGVPGNAVAVTGNLTVTGQTGAGYVSITVAPTSSPATSTLNFPLNDNRANNVTVPLSAAGTLSAVYKAASGKTTQLIFDVTGYFLDDVSGATYRSVSPARILDSRTGNGGYTTPFVANQQRSFLVWGRGGVPTTATAVTGNLTVTGQTKPGYLTLSNVNTNTPSTSTLNFPVGDNRANGVSVALTNTGRLYAVYKAASGATANVIFDITGYYVPGTGGLRYFPLNPGRILDGRINLGLSGTFSAGTARTLDVDGHLGVPIGAAAITGNVTVTGQTKPGYASMTPTATNSPSTSTINFPVGDNRANGVTGPLSSGTSAGNLSFVYKAASPATTYLLLDVTGYFKSAP